jgi:hypothetical protein
MGKGHEHFPSSKRTICRFHFLRGVETGVFVNIIIIIIIIINPKRRKGNVDNDISRDENRVGTCERKLYDFLC